MELLDNRVMIRPIRKEKITAGGIIIPETTKNMNLSVGEALSVGKTDWVKEGMKILYLENTGSKIDWKGEVVQVVFEDDVIAIVDDPDAIF
jgi:co-chaperonin GroES (HSP10)